MHWVKYIVKAMYVFFFLLLKNVATGKFWGLWSSSSALCGDTESHISSSQRKPIFKVFGPFSQLPSKPFFYHNVFLFDHVWERFFHFLVMEMIR